MSLLVPRRILPPLKVKRHFQLTIPASPPAKLQLTEGDYVQADVEDGKIIIRPV
jgi:AbrB family looped-hinge helix DNA binding protein